MSKVIHLSNEAHAMAKSYCKSRGMRMSDWVAGLIQAAVADANSPEPITPVEPAPQITPRPALRSQPPRLEQRRVRSRPELPKVTPRFDSRRSPVAKKSLPKSDEERPFSSVDNAPDYAAPPFWARRSADAE